VFLVKNGVGRGTARLTATDGSGNTETCDLTINLPPTAGGDAYVVQRNVARSVLASGVLANDSDPDGDLFTAVLEDLPDHGTLSLDPNGAFTYTPAPGYTGEDSFSYRASDGIHLSSPATVLLTVVNTAPVALGNSHTGWRNCPLQVGVPGVLGNDSDADGDPLTASLVQGPVAGSLSLNPNGAFIYTPNPGTTGDSFTYRAFDGVDYSSPVTVTLTLQADTVKPTAVVGSVVSETSPVRVYVPVTVSDGQSGVVRVELTSNSSNCTLSVAGQAGSVLTFDPAMASVVVRAVKVDPTRGARVELKVTDCAGNAAIVDPVITELVIPAGARSVTQTYSGLPTAERYVEAQNRRPGVRLLSVRVNGVGGGVLKLAPGAVGKLDAARWMRAGDSNVFTLTAYGKPGARVLVIIGDSPGTGGGARTRSAAGAAARPGVNLNWGRD
jgi:VCBS repeat-containing protein